MTYHFYYLTTTIDLKIDNLDRVSIPTKIVATFDVEHPILGTTNEHPKSVNSGKITSALHVFYLNLYLLAQNSANCSDTGIQLRMHALFRRHKVVPRIGCSTSKVATIFVGIETLSRLPFSDQ